MAQLVAGKYRLKVAIGQGPHGVLWRAQHEGTLEDLVVKVLNAEFADDRSVVDRFNRERTVLTAFLHPSYVRVRELEAEAGSIALVTELVTGTDLRHELARSGPLSAETATEIAAACADIVAAGHEAGVVHCDIKPSNIMLTSGSRRVRLTDCRVARLARGRRVGRHRFADPRYAAPEVALGGPPEPATDIYGLGLILHEMVTGTPRVGHEQTPSGRHAAPVDHRLRDIVEACLATDPVQRPSGQWLAAELRDLSSRSSSSQPAADLPGGALLHTYVTRARSLPARRDRPAPRDPGHPDRSHQRDRPGLSGGLSKATIAVTAAALTAGLAIGAIAVGAKSLSQPGQSTGTEPSSGTQPSLASARAEPRLSDAAATESGPGAIAFAHYWFDTLTYAARTGDTGPLASASSPNCGACTAAIQAIGAAHNTQSSMRGGAYTVRSVHMDSFFDLGRPTLRVVFDRSARTTVDAAGREIDALPGATFESCQIVLERTGGRWRVVDSQSSAPVA